MIFSKNDTVKKNTLSEEELELLEDGEYEILTGIDKFKEDTNYYLSIIPYNSGIINEKMHMIM